GASFELGELGSRIMQDIDVEEERMLGAPIQAYELAVDRFSFFDLAEGAELDGVAALPQHRVRAFDVGPVGPARVVRAGDGALSVHEERVRRSRGRRRRRIVFVVTCHSRILTTRYRAAHVGRHPTWTALGARGYNRCGCIPSGIIRFCS